MQILMRDKDDSTLILVVATSITYDRSDMELHVGTVETDYVIEKITEVNANSVIQELYDKGKADVTMYPAYEDEY